MYNNEELQNILNKYEREYRRSALKWKIGYKFFLILSVVFSLISAMLMKATTTEWIFLYHLKINQSDAPFLAVLAAIFTTIIGSLDFEKNWKINRRSRHEIDLLRLKLKKSNADSDQILDGIQQVIKNRIDDLTKL